MQVTHSGAGSVSGDPSPERTRECGREGGVVPHLLRQRAEKVPDPLLLLDINVEVAHHHPDPATKCPASGTVHRLLRRDLLPTFTPPFRRRPNPYR